MVTKATSKVIKTERYTLRLKASERLLVEQAAKAAGVTVAEFWGGVTEAVAVVILQNKQMLPEYLTSNELKYELGQAVIQALARGIVLKQAEEESSKTSEEEVPF